MKFEDIKFPVYRRYKNNKSYFKIINPKRFEEIQVIGIKRVVRETDAIQFPEMNFIRDLVFQFSEMAEEITEQEYVEQKALANKAP
jgi:hypothetical protein